MEDFLRIIKESLEVVFFFIIPSLKIVLFLPQFSVEEKSQLIKIE